MSRPNVKPVKNRRASAAAAMAYVASRDPRRYGRTSQEEEIIRTWLGQLPRGAVVWDCPCGTGRFVPTAAALGLRYVGADVAAAMVEEARRVATDSAAKFLVADAENLPLADNSVDCVLLWRLLHHIHDPAQRQRMLREASRITRRLVLVSFHHPISFTFVRRLPKRVFTGDWEISDITHWRLTREAAAAGLQTVETKSFRKYVSINWFACLRKTASNSGLPR